MRVIRGTDGRVSGAVEKPVTLSPDEAKGMGDPEPDADVAGVAERLHEGRLVYRFFKRVFDIVFSAAVLILLSWLFVNVFLGEIPLRILKTRPEFSDESMGAFALPAKSSTNERKVFSQVASCFASGLRMRRILGLNCKRVGSMGGQFLAKPVFKAMCA